MQRLAIYDMDKTITAAPTWTRFLFQAVRTRAPWRLLLMPLVGAAGAGHLLNLVDRATLKQISQRLLLGHSLTAADLEALAERFADAEVGNGILHGARERIEADRAAGYRLVMATASHGYYAAGIARRLGFDDVVATQAQRDAHGRILSLIEGDNCYGPAKLRMIEDWMRRAGVSRGAVHVRAYSDHVSDAPLLEWADEPFAVNAHGPLKRLSVARGWQELDWR